MKDALRKLSRKFSGGTRASSPRGVDDDSTAAGAGAGTAITADFPSASSATSALSSADSIGATVSFSNDVGVGSF